MTVLGLFRFDFHSTPRTIEIHNVFILKKKPNVERRLNDVLVSSNL